MAGDKGKRKSTMRSTQQTQKNGASNNAKANVSQHRDEIFSDNEEVWQCKFCKEDFRDDDDKLMECERCFKKVCLGCTNGEVDEEKYNAINQDGSPFFWFCSDCKPNALQAIQTDFKIEEKCKDYYEKLKKEFSDKFEGISHEFKKVHDKIDEIKMDKFDKKIKEIEEQISNLSELETGKSTQEPNCTDTKTVISDSTSELEEREKRKSNLIFFRIPESTSTDTETRKADDLRQIREIGKKVFELNDSVFLKSNRLGKSASGTTRPLKVTLDKAERATEILKNARKLGEEKFKDYKHISIQKDMTPLEQEENKKLLKLRHELREKTKREKTSEVWVIRGRKVINVERK